MSSACVFVSPPLHAKRLVQCDKVEWGGNGTDGAKVCRTRTRDVRVLYIVQEQRHCCVCVYVCVCVRV